MKKVFSIIALALMTTFVACGSGETKEEAPATDTTATAAPAETAPVEAAPVDTAAAATTDTTKK